MFRVISKSYFHSLHEIAEKLSSRASAFRLPPSALGLALIGSSSVAMSSGFGNKLADASGAAIRQ
ncbi:hypothetical protein M569_01582 [Genlisea aurea]|uniref:Uncharacterized protein n=1 Tax=Genlisea aurea TaxID=192259 RepID=S8D196_9LAMI|nr:hypothetical protein M569_01582 [Genlisea aurea]